MLNGVHSIHSKIVVKETTMKYEVFVMIQKKEKDKLRTALLVLISIAERRYSKTFSRFPARAARKKPEFPSDQKKNNMKFLRQLNTIKFHIPTDITIDCLHLNDIHFLCLTLCNSTINNHLLNQKHRHNKLAHLDKILLILSQKTDFEQDGQI